MLMNQGTPGYVPVHICDNIHMGRHMFVQVCLCLLMYVCIQERMCVCVCMCKCKCILVCTNNFTNLQPF